MDDRIGEVLNELGTVIAGIDEASVQALCEAIVGARRIAVAGCGREFLQVRGFAMRLFHLGLDVGVMGEMTFPPVAKGDLFLFASGPGELASMQALLTEAKKAGAATFVLTAQAESTAAKEADQMLLIPAQTMASDQGAARTSVLPMGSLFEGALFLLFELLVLRLQRMTGETLDSMRARHTNLE